MRTEISTSVARAVSLLRAGEAIALPSETVYGLAADALRPEAVARIFEIKERPFFDPLICHLPDESWLERMAAIPAGSQRTVTALTARFWPGPLTLVLPRRPFVPDLVTSGLETVALRRSAHPLFQAVLEEFGGPLAAPSANRFGRISPTAAEHVRAELGGRIPLILEGGACVHGVESTIVAVEGESLRLLRHGPVTVEELRAFGSVTRASGEKVEAPGQLRSHYAPRTPMKLGLGAPDPRAGLLAWRSAPPGYAAVEILSPAGDLREAAATLFARLRRLDALALERIVCEPVPETGLGVAIMDRLRRGAARD